MKPNKKRLKLWVKALRNGKYKQTTGALRDNNKYCCLGVACAVYREQTKEGKWNGETFSVGKLNAKSILSSIVSKWFGLNTCNPVLIVNYHANKHGRMATDLNDYDKYTFNEIASAIEETFKL